jgi:type VI protein secretion system component VasK
VSLALPELIAFSGAVYGLSWLLTKSALFGRPRRILAALPYVGRLLGCIVCTAPWVGLALVFVAPTSSHVIDSVRPRGIVDGVLFVGWLLFSTWTVARLMGDAT